MTCHFFIYNVRLGQCIGILPEQQTEYAMMIDCGHDDDFHPINNFGLFLPKSIKDPSKSSLRSLVITNYDHDHFSGLPKLYRSTQIKSVLFPNNLSMEEIRNLKSESTEALNTLEHIRTTYTEKVVDWKPPFTRKVFSLTQSELINAEIPVLTNHLSQIVFVEYGETTLCIPGDIENRSWELMLKKEDVQNWLRKTNILIASHHGRENGYHKGIFDFCKPSCVIFSDKEIVHETQKDMSRVYANHVIENGISFTTNSGYSTDRKILTTRNDGHIRVSVPLYGTPTFQRLL